MKRKKHLKKARLLKKRNRVAGAERRSEDVKMKVGERRWKNKSQEDARMKDLSQNKVISEKPGEVAKPIISKKHRKHFNISL